MSPAGHWPQLHAAIEAGADAVYFGLLKNFTARAKVGFSLEELPEAMRTLHKRGVRGFVTFNTLVFEHELRQAARAIEEIAGAGADALIIQDYGILRLARRIAPEIELHASTQMSITDSAGVRLALRHGATRVTLARELSLPEIRRIVDETNCEIEVFVHGALCVAYSGQCFSSEAWGGRSANRGQCAQACRLPYEMLVDGEKRPLGDARYLLSPGDLYALEQVPELIDIGVATLKIEGRYKDEDYVALTTAAYRRAVDQAWAGQATVSPDAAERLRLEQAYSRGLGPWFIAGTNHQTVVRGRAPRHRGVEAGTVTRVGPASVWIEAPANGTIQLKPGDGIVFDAADWRDPSEPEEGGRLYQVHPEKDAPNTLELRFANNAVNFSRIRRGDLVWRTHDPSIDQAAQPYLKPAAPVAKQPVHVALVARPNAKLRTTWTSGAHTVTVESDDALQTAQNRSLTAEAARAQLDRLGNTPYQLADLDAQIEGQPFVPASLLNNLRRTAVDLLQHKAAEGRPHPVHPASAELEALLPKPKSSPEVQPAVPELHLLIRTPDQLDAAIAARPNSITLDYLDLYGLRPSVERVRGSGVPVRVASPRVLKPGEARIVDFLKNLDCPLLLRAAGMVDILAPVSAHPLTGDFSLNAANTITAETYFALGLSRLSPTHDLNAQQIAALARSAGGDRIEVVAYQHLPVFHTEHCVFCRFLSTGTSYKDCGRPCESHRVALEDRTGRAHPVMADVGCRNTVFGAEAQEASGHLDLFLSAGIRHYRLEFVHESPAQLREIAAAFKEALAGKIGVSDLATRLRRATPSGVTEGSLFVPKDYLTLPILQ